MFGAIATILGNTEPVPKGVLILNIVAASVIYPVKYRTFKITVLLLW